MTGLRCGIVGLPNVGKSTLFNALTATSKAEVGNFPFCTIEPNIGRVSIPDPRLDAIAEVASAPRKVPNRIEFVDIAGLVRGASRGEGLGNQFLANIRETDAIIHLVRCFNDREISHVTPSCDPLDDIATVETELLLSDLEKLERNAAAMEKRATGGDKDARKQLPLVRRILALLEKGRPAREVELSGGELRAFKMLHLLTSKPVLYVCNIDEDAGQDGRDLYTAVARHASDQKAACVGISARIEAELAEITDPVERLLFMKDLGLEEPGLNLVIRAAYRLLTLETFFTAGPKEARAWTIRSGSRAIEAAEAIHTDFARGFICAETIAFQDFIEHGGELGARNAGKMRREGRDYRVADGDVLLIRFNV